MSGRNITTAEGELVAMTDQTQAKINPTRKVLDPLSALQSLRAFRLLRSSRRGKNLFSDHQDSIPPSTPTTSILTVSPPESRRFSTSGYRDPAQHRFRGAAISRAGMHIYLKMRTPRSIYVHLIDRPVILRRAFPKLASRRRASRRRAFPWRAS